LVCLSYQFVCDFVKQFTFVINETWVRLVLWK
jgi:hypothetical protein